MDLSKTRVSDPDSIEEGQWCTHPQYDDVEVKVRSIHSKAYRDRIRQLQNREKMKTRKTGDVMATQVEIEMKATPVLLTDWKGLHDAGEVIPFSPDFARAMADEWVKDHVSHREFWEGVRELAQDLGAGEMEAREESLGN